MSQVKRLGGQRHQGWNVPDMFAEWQGGWCGWREDSKEGKSERRSCKVGGKQIRLDVGGLQVSQALILDALMSCAIT